MPANDTHHARHIHPTPTHDRHRPSPPAAQRPARVVGEDGSLVSEYGLIAVLGATITGVAISWAKGGAIATLLNVILRQVRALVGA